MIYTSYLGNLKNIPEGLKKVSIMRFTPEWAKEYIDDINLKLAPSANTLLSYRDKKIDREEYIKQFKETLYKTNPKTLKKKLDNSVLLCTCRLGRFCHRHIVSEYLRKHNIVVRELPVKDSLKAISVEVIDWLTVKECKKNPDKIYVFGDNSIRKGKKGQAVIRDCPNTFGVATKRFPSMKYGSFFNDSREDEAIVFNDLYRLRELAYNGKTIVFPKDGLGLGLANMGLHSPHLHIKMYTFIEDNFMKFLNSKSENRNIIIAGTRKFNDYDLLVREVDKYIDDNNIKNVTIYTGDARGADKLGNKYAKQKKYELVKFPADWDKYGMSAGYIRNAEMSKDATDLVAFWDGKSKGTKNMIDIAKKKKIKVKVVRY